MKFSDIKDYNAELELINKGESKLSKSNRRKVIDYCACAVSTYSKVSITHKDKVETLLIKENNESLESYQRQYPYLDFKVLETGISTIPNKFRVNYKVSNRTESFIVEDSSDLNAVLAKSEIKAYPELMTFISGIVFKRMNFVDITGCE